MARLPLPCKRNLSHLSFSMHASIQPLITTSLMEINYLVLKLWGTAERQASQRSRRLISMGKKQYEKIQARKQSWEF